jgi:hypothetical protein
LRVGGFVSVNSLIDIKRTLDPSLQDVHGFVHSPNASRQSPLELATALEADAAAALSLLVANNSRLEVVVQAAGNHTLQSEINDVRAWAYLGQYFALKLRGSVELCVHRSTKAGNKTAQKAAIRWLKEAQGAWDSVVNTTSIYLTDDIPLLDLGTNGSFHWAKFVSAVARDVEIARA